MKKIEAIVKPFKLDDVKETLTAAAKTGSIGDGKVFVSSLDDALRIRTGEHGESAL